MIFGLSCCVDWLVEANVSEKHAVSIVRAEVMSWDCEGPYVGLMERKSEGKGPVRTSEAEAELDK
jgi:hypothetical protein